MLEPGLFGLDAAAFDHCRGEFIASGSAASGNWLPTRFTVIGPPPLKGMCTQESPARRAISSMARWVEPPTAVVP